MNVMKKFILGLVILLTFAGLVYSAFKFLPQPSGKQGLLSDADVEKSKRVVKCNLQTHECVYPDDAANAGSLKIKILAEGRSVKNLKVELGDRPGAPEFYIKYTNSNGVALFEDIPANNYIVYFEKGYFPKDYGEAYGITVPVEVIKDQTVEKTIELM